MSELTPGVFKVSTAIEALSAAAIVQGFVPSVILPGYKQERRNAPPPPPPASLAVELPVAVSPQSASRLQPLPPAAVSFPQLPLQDPSQNSSQDRTRVTLEIEISHGDTSSWNSGLLAVSIVLPVIVLAFFVWFGLAVLRRQQRQRCSNESLLMSSTTSSAAGHNLERESSSDRAVTEPCGPRTSDDGSQQNSTVDFDARQAGGPEDPASASTTPA